MHEQFELTVELKGGSQQFPSTLVIFGYSHHFQVQVQGITINFEPDEEGTYKAVLNPVDMRAAEKIDPEIFQAIANALETIGT